MSKHASSSSTSYGAWALAAWLAALALFLIWLGWVLFSTSPDRGKGRKTAPAGCCAKRSRHCAGQSARQGFVDRS